MEESEYFMWMKRKQILKSQLEAPLFGGSNNNNNSSYSWVERAFEEDAARIVEGCTWPPRCYSCSFCKREFRCAQALGGHMNVHRRDRARLKQNLSPHNEHEPLHHHKNDCNSLGADQFSAERSSTQENCGHHIPSTKSHYSSRSISSRVHQKGSPNYSEPEERVTGENFEGLDCNNNYVETSLSMGLSSNMLRQKLPCRDEANNSCKRLKSSNNISSLLKKPCSNDRLLAFQAAEIVLGLNPGMEDLDLELRLGKPQKVKECMNSTDTKL